MNTPLAHPLPWYRHPWPWLLMAGPAIVVVAGLVTYAFAVQSFDGLVADDYYKQGKAINKTMHRDTRAREMGLAATVAVDAARGEVRVHFAGAVPSMDLLRLTLHHPTRGGQDREVVLHRAEGGNYVGALPGAAAARWHLTLDDAGREWRLTGDWRPGDAATSLGAGR